MPQDTIGITILHTNDMHCELEARSGLSGPARRAHQDLAAHGRAVF